MPDPDAPAGSRRTGVRGRSRLTWLAAAAAVLLIGAATAYAVVRGPSPAGTPTVEGEPTVVTVSLPEAAGSQRCMVPTAEVLSTADLAFDGEVTDAGRTVTLVPARIYAGGPADQVRVVQSARSRPRLVPGVRFEEGGRYLVAARDGDVMVCGFSGPHEPRLARLYRQAFPE